jgi:hypothetical protein
MNFEDRIEALERRLTELEQRLPKPIPVVEPLADDYVAPPFVQLTPEVTRQLNQQSEEHALMQQIAAMMGPLDAGTPRWVRDPEFHEACDLLKEALAGHEEDPDGNIGRSTAERIRAFLTRARVTRGVP